MLNATVSGSFHRHMEAITSAVHELASLNVRVLSPSDPRIVAQQGEFLFVASDAIRSVRLVQDRHLDTIRAADFLWLVCPDGSVGQSACLEIGYAIREGVPMFSTRAPNDLTLREYIKVVPTLATAVDIARVTGRSRRPKGILIDPHATVEKAHIILDRVGAYLTRPNTEFDAAPLVHRDLAILRHDLSLPTHL